MTASEGHSPAALLVGTLADAAVVIDAEDRVLAWNAAAEARLSMTAAAAGRTLAEMGLANLSGASRLPLAAGSAGGAVAIVTVGTRMPAVDRDAMEQKARALARLAPGVTHEMGNHIGGFRAFSTLLRAEQTALGVDDEELFGQLQVSAERAARLMEAFTQLARERVPDPRPTPLASAVRGPLALGAYQMMDVALTVTVPSDLPEVTVDALRLHQALVAIVVNELDALGLPHAHGTLDVRARTIPGSGLVELAFEDDAPMVPEAARASLFDAEPPAGASPRAGLDLAIARRLIELDGGTLRYEPGPGGVNRLLVTLPASGTRGRAAVATPAWPRAGAEDGPSSRITVLVCDDDRSIRALLARMLERNHHRVLQAESGAAALAILDEERVDVVMTDHTMVAMSGTQLYAAACVRHPHLATRFVLMSGNPDDEVLVAFTSSTGLRVLGKPFALAELDGMIRDLVAG